tara:strand:- start:320 stop:697 length:378 start_codon:yes stop_codon:yes gene_type:complete
MSVIHKQSISVLGTPLASCCTSPNTGFFRDGSCNTCDEDYGSHTVCILVTQDFLDFSKAAGNDLSTPNDSFNFPGLVPGDRWCLCAPRWQEALEAGVAPPVFLESTHMDSLKYVSIHDLNRFAVN